MMADKENLDKPKFRKLLSKSDLSAPPLGLVKQRAVLAPRPDNQTTTSFSSSSSSSSIHMPKFQLKPPAAVSESNLAPSIHHHHHAQVLLQKPSRTNTSFALDLKPKPLPVPVAPLSKAVKREIAPAQPPPPKQAKSYESPIKPIITKASSPSPLPKPHQTSAAEEVVLEEEKETEQNARARRKLEETTRKGTDMVNRARALELQGKTASALALFKESLLYFPGNATLETRVAKLKHKLLAERTGMTSSQSASAALATDQGEEEDALEAMFAVVAVAPVAPKTATTTAVTARRARVSSISCVVDQTDMTPLQLLSQRLKEVGKTHATWQPLVQFTTQLLQVERTASLMETAKFQRVRFHVLDCAVIPPTTAVHSDEEMDSQLYPVEQVIDVLRECVKLADEAKRSLAVATASTVNEFASSALLLRGEGGDGEAYGQFLTCMLGKSIMGKCQCNKPCIAVAVKQRLGQMLSTAMRCVLRRVFNHQAAQVLLVPNTGSYRFAGDDVAAVVHQALLLFETRLPVVDNLVLMRGTSNSSSVNVDDIGLIGEFVQAHRFLMEMFPSAHTCAELTDRHPQAWAKLRKYLAVAREFKLLDELVLSPLANLEGLVGSLRQQLPLVKACQAHVDFAYRIALREDKCGQCNCEGAKRRRANAMGMWMAPTLSSSSQKTATASCTLESCATCSQPVLANNGSGGIACECCEKQFHLSCLGLPKGYESDFVCGKCMPKFLHRS
ncbi:hypothetical protein BASA81_000631 [Batrachochytrium salamandrivorans]|nr:hypothetical protein BASA81_000631 [Batrachochytrium salamandrivorans]